MPRVAGRVGRVFTRPTGVAFAVGLVKTRSTSPPLRFSFPGSAWECPASEAPPRLISGAREDSGGPSVPKGGRVAQRQEAAPCQFNWTKDVRFTNRAIGLILKQLHAYDETSCRYATQPPAYCQKGRDGWATRPFIASADRLPTRTCRRFDFVPSLAVAVYGRRVRGFVVRSPGLDLFAPTHWRLKSQPHLSPVHWNLSSP